MWTEWEARDYLNQNSDSDDSIAQLVCKLASSLLLVIDAERNGRLELLMENAALKTQLNRKEE